MFKLAESLVKPLGFHEGPHLNDGATRVELDLRVDVLEGYPVFDEVSPLVHSLLEYCHAVQIHPLLQILFDKIINTVELFVKL